MSYKILNGNELLIQGGLEAGFNLYTGYPGSPLADFFNILHERKEEFREKGIRVVLANSEANAAAMASGAKMAGQNVLVAMKSMGLHVASDALSVGNFANPGGEKKSGVVIAVGDDPWSISTSTPADSRYLFKHLHIPFLEPSSPQELKDWMSMALTLSQESSVYVGVVLTTFMAEGGGRVKVFEEKKLSTEPITLNPAEFNLSSSVMVPPHSLFADKEMIQKRFPKVKEVLSRLALDRVMGNEESSYAVISSGGVFETLCQVLENQKLLNFFSVYKAAGPYPLNEDQLLPFLKTKKVLLVVEEKRGFLEDEVRSLVGRENLSVKVFGKQIGEREGFPSYGGLSFEIIHEKVKLFLETLSETTLKNQCELSSDQFSHQSFSVPKRLPTFCPGCPHRETLSIMKEIRSILKEKKIDLVSHGDVGCYSLSFLEPFKEMHDLSAMGQGGSLGAGADIFITNPSVVLMGDSTFFHSGMTSISNSVQMGHNITYILLDNDNTAMTGHQVTPRTGMSVEGEGRPRQNMLEVAKSLRVHEAIEVNPSDRYYYKNLLLDFVQKKGVKVIVSNKECALTFHGRKKKEERVQFKQGETLPVKEFYQINTLACEDCRACVEMTGCPGLSQTFDAYGTKVMIDPQICVADSYCTKIKACPSFELVKVYDYHPTKYKTDSSLIKNWEHLSTPVITKTLQDIADGLDYRAVVIGVGGSGVTTISRIIAEGASEMAGREDLKFKFMDQKGLAQRNGSVISHLSLYSEKKYHGPVAPLGSSDLVVSPDLLEGGRALEYLGPSGLLIVDEEFQIPLSILLDRGIESTPLSAETLRKELKEKLKERVIIAPTKKMSFERFNRPVYASAMILGISYQAGRLPFEEKHLHEAFRSALPRAEFESNWEAFQMGREWFIKNFKREELQETNSASVDSSSHGDDEMNLWEKSVGLSAYPWQSQQKLINFFKSYTSILNQKFSEIPAHHLWQYVHDLLVFDHEKSFPEFLESALRLKELYEKEEFSIAFRVMVKTFWIKDEVFVAHQMISPLKTILDEKNYKDLGSSFEVVHINRPSFVVWGKKIEFDFSPKTWMLKLMRHMRILRLLLSDWHREEKSIAQTIRRELLENKLERKRLLELDNIKGYREVRYQKAEEYLGKKLWEK